MNGWKKYLGTRDFYAKVFRIAIPISLQSLITVGVNLMDTIMLSSMGDAQLSASSLATQFINIFQILRLAPSTQRVYTEKELNESMQCMGLDFLLGQPFSKTQDPFYKI